MSAVARMDLPRRVRVSRMWRNTIRMAPTTSVAIPRSGLIDKTTTPLIDRRGTFWERRMLYWLMLVPNNTFRKFWRKTVIPMDATRAATGPRVDSFLKTRTSIRIPRSAVIRIANTKPQRMSWNQMTFIRSAMYAPKVIIEKPDGMKIAVWFILAMTNPSATSA